MIVQTWPAARKPWTRFVGATRIARIAGGTSTCETSIEKLREALALGLVDRHGVGGRGRLEADGEEDDLAAGIGAGERQARRAASRRRGRRRPRDLAAEAGRRRCPGTRSMSPNEQRIVPGRPAIASALSM